MRLLAATVASISVIALCACSEAPQPQTSTAQLNVTVLSKVVMPQLERERSVRIYLPPAYATSDKAYPVLYMHDGQNLFDDATSYAGEWGVDETLNTLAENHQLELIVVGIDNGGVKRMNELSPWPNDNFGPAEGEQYTRFIVDTLKPQIDRQYRTLPDPEHTAIMGSSMGGLISHYAIYAYPEVFGKAGIFSPSYWYSDNVFRFSAANEVPDDHRLYLLVGEQEGADMVAGVNKMHAQILSSHNPNNLYREVVPEAGHNETFWREHFWPSRVMAV